MVSAMWMRLGGRVFDTHHAQSFAGLKKEKKEMDGSAQLEGLQAPVYKMHTNRNRICLEIEQGFLDGP